MENYKPDAPLAPRRWFVISEIEKVIKIELECSCKEDAEAFCLYLMHQNPGRWFVEPETQSTSIPTSASLLHE